MGPRQNFIPLGLDAFRLAINNLIRGQRIQGAMPMAGVVPRYEPRTEYPRFIQGTEAFGIRDLARQYASPYAYGANPVNEVDADGTYFGEGDVKLDGALGDDVYEGDFEDYNTFVTARGQFEKHREQVFQLVPFAQANIREAGFGVLGDQVRGPFMGSKTRAAKPAQPRKRLPGIVDDIVVQNEMERFSSAVGR